MSKSRKSSPEAAADQPVDLKALRDQIDAIDEKIQALINERARCAQQVAIAWKAKRPQVSHAYDALRPCR